MDELLTEKLSFHFYQKLALVTEAPVTQEVRERFEQLRPLLQAMLSGTDTTLWSLADPVKRHIFYGAAFPPESSLRIQEFLRNGFCIAKPEGPDLPAEDAVIRMIHAWLGLLSEIPELGEAILKGDRQNLAEESGDLKWYNALLDTALGMNGNTVAAANLAKLWARYAQKFSEKAALDRDLQRELHVFSQYISNSPTSG